MTKEQKREERDALTLAFAEHIISEILNENKSNGYIKRNDDDPVLSSGDLYKIKEVVVHNTDYNIEIERNYSSYNWNID